MTIEEAIKLLHPDTTGEGIMELQYYGGFEAKEKVIKAIEEACILACAALEKQIPKNPYLSGDGYWNGQLVYDIWDCPNCGKSYEVDYDNYDYCPECGQRIDWKVEE